MSNITANGQAATPKVGISSRQNMMMAATAT
jgi:hypothetical protein